MIEVMVVIGIIGVLIGLLLPATRATGPPLAVPSAQSNLKNLVLALHAFMSTSTMPCRRPTRSMRTASPCIAGHADSALPGPRRALPDDRPLQTVERPGQRQGALKPLFPFFGALKRQGPLNTTTYLAIAVPNGRSNAGKGRRLSEITDSDAVDAHGDRGRRGTCRPLDGSRGCG